MPDRRPAGRRYEALTWAATWVGAFSLSVRHPEHTTGWKFFVVNVVPCMKKARKFFIQKEDEHELPRLLHREAREFIAKLVSDTFFMNSSTTKFVGKFFFMTFVAVMSIDMLFFRSSVAMMPISMFFAGGNS